MRSAVITGASTGIGWATAKLLLERGFRVFGSVRKPADADRPKAEFGANFVPLQFDVTDEAAVLAAAREVRTVLAGETLAGLVNNAGIAVAGPVLEVSADEFRRQMEVNVIGPIIATQAFGPLLGSDPSLKGPRGKIVMISSVAGRSGNPLSSAYVASKAALEAYQACIALSPNQKFVAADAMDLATTNTDLWIYDLENESAKRLTFDPAIDSTPLWSPDGTKLVFTSDRAQKFNL